MLALGAAGGVADGAASTSADDSAVSLDSGGGAAMAQNFGQNFFLFEILVKTANLKQRARLERGWS